MYAHTRTHTCTHTRTHTHMHTHTHVHKHKHTHFPQHTLGVHMYACTHIYTNSDIQTGTHRYNTHHWVSKVSIFTDLTVSSRVARQACITRGQSIIGQITCVTEASPDKWAGTRLTGNSPCWIPKVSQNTCLTVVTSRVSSATYTNTCVYIAGRSKTIAVAHNTTVSQMPARPVVPSGTLFTELSCVVGWTAADLHGIHCGAGNSGGHCLLQLGELQVHPTGTLSGIQMGTSKVK